MLHVRICAGGRSQGRSLPRQSFLDRVGLDTIDGMSKCRDALVLQLVA
jgi:hypothetical protein